MTKVEYRHNEINIAGHAGFNPGNDIVCAAISILCCALDASCEGKRNYSSTGIECDGLFRAKYTGQDTRVYAWFKMAITGLKILAEEYPEHLTVTKV